MGINLDCIDCEFQDRQCGPHRRDLMDALRAYLKDHQEEHEIELKYVNFFYRDDEDDQERVTEISDDEKKLAVELLKEKKLDGLFCYMFLNPDERITYQAARRFIEAYRIIKIYMKSHESFMRLDIPILMHAARNEHDLVSW